MKVGFILFTLLIYFTTVYAENYPKKEFATTENGSTIITATVGNSAIICAGSITAEEGSSVRLLPGTLIKAGDELTVSIVSHEYFDDLAEKAEEEEQKKVVANIMERHDTHVKPVEAAVLLRLPGAASRRSQVQQQLNLHAALPTRDQNSTSQGILMNRLLSSHSGDCCIPQSTLNNPYLPSRSWGNCGETVAVMRT